MQFFRWTDKIIYKEKQIHLHGQHVYNKYVNT